MGSIFGGGSAPSGGTTTGFPVSGQAQAYQPQFQPNIDYGLANLVQGQPYSLLGQYQSGNTPAQQLYYQQALPQSQAGFDLVNSPQSSAGQIPGNVFNNPYYQQAQTGSLVNAALIGGQYGGGQGQIANLINQGLDLSQPGVLQAIQNIQQGGQTLGGYAGNVAGLAPDVQNYAGQTGALAGAFPGLSAEVGGLFGPTTGLAQQATANIPAISQLGGQVGGTLPQYQQIANQIGGIGQAAGLGPNISSLNQASNQLLQTGMDPRSALYNRTAQQVLDQQRAVNAMSGVGTSPYGAGVTGQTMANFNMDWQNQQLTRQAQALQGAGAGFGQAGNLAGLQGTLQGQAANVLSGLGAQAGAAGGLYGQAGNLAGTGANIYGQAGNLAQGAGGLLTAGGAMNQAAVNQLLGAGNLYGQAGQLTGQGMNANQAAAALYSGLPGLSNAYTQAYGNLGNLIQQSAAQPGQTYLGQQQAQQSALNSYLQQLGLSQGLTTGATNIGQAQYGLPLSLLGNMQNYLNTGLQAAVGGGQLGQIGTNQATQGVQGLIGAGQLGSQLLTGQSLFGGSNSLLGSSGGLLGAFGLGGGAGADLTGLFAGGAAGTSAGAGLTVTDLLPLLAAA